MAITAIDPSSALVVIDLQKGITSRPTIHTLSTIVSQASRLAVAFRAKGLPVVLVNATGAPGGRTEHARARGELPAGWTELLPELDPQAGDHLVSKRSPGAFTNTDLESFLKARAVTQIVLAGVSTSMGVEATGRHALELGFNVAFATDAMTDMDPELHTNSMTRIFPRIGETAATQEIIDLLDSRDG